MTRCAVGVCAGFALAACQHVPPKPLDPAANGARLIARSLEDPAVVAALSEHGLAARNTWSLDQLTLAAWALRTDVEVARSELGAARAATVVAGQRPNPTLGVTNEKVVNAGTEHPWVVGPTVSLTLETGHKREIRRARSLAAEQALEWQFGETLWSARAAVRKAYLDHALAVELVALDEREAGFRRGYLEWVETLLEHGAAASQQRLLAMQAVSEIDSRLELDRSDRARSQAALAAALGVSPSELARIEPAPPGLNAIPTVAAADVDTARDLALTNRLDVRRALAEYEVAEQDLRAAVASQYPSITLGPGTLADQADHKITLALDLPVPLRRTSNAAIRQAIAARAVAAARFDEVQAAVLAAIDVSFAQYRSLRDALAAAQRAEQEAAAGLAVVQRQFDAGGASRGDLLAAQIALGTRQRNTFEARRALLDSITALENGIERPLFPASSIETTATIDEMLAKAPQ